MYGNYYYYYHCSYCCQIHFCMTLYVGFDWASHVLVQNRSQFSVELETR